MASGFVSVFLINSNGSLTFANGFGTGQSKPIGIGAVTNSGTDYVFTANMTGNFVQPFIRTAASLAQQTSVPDSFGPTGLIIDPSGLFFYTGNSGSGTIAQLNINSAACKGQAVCVVEAFNSESPANSNAGTQFLAVTH
jgi:DNA-binding beta-propeller fold protein YncE